MDKMVSSSGKILFSDSSADERAVPYMQSDESILFWKSSSTGRVGESSHPHASTGIDDEDGADGAGQA